MEKNPLSEVAPWDLVAKGYVSETAPVFEKWARDSFVRVQPRSSDTVLDIACGPGTVALLLAPLVHRVTALDFSPAMIGALNDAVSTRGIRNITAAVCDCSHLDFPDNTFDLAFSQFGLMFFQDRQRGFDEIYRVLRPEGRTAVYSWAPIAESEAMSAMMGALGEAFPETKPKSDEKKTIVSGLDDPAVFENELKRAGFQKVVIEPVRHSFPVKGPVHFWESMVKGSAPVTLMKSRTDPREWEERTAVATGWLARHLEGKTKLYSTAFLGTGVKNR